MNRASQPDHKDGTADGQRRLGEFLADKRLISQEQLKAVLAEQKISKEVLGAILVRKGYIKEIDLLKALSEQFRIPLMSLKDRYMDWALMKQFSPSLILDLGCIPIEKNGETITIGINNPLDAWALKKAEEDARGFRLKLALISRADADETIRRYKEYIRDGIDNLFK